MQAANITSATSPKTSIVKSSIRPEIMTHRARERTNVTRHDRYRGRVKVSPRAINQSGPEQPQVTAAAPRCPVEHHRHDSDATHGTDDITLRSARRSLQAPSLVW